jgi:pimeloyl-ACP methyl ester carboxylesterase
VFLILLSDNTVLTDSADGMEPIADTVPTAATSIQASALTRSYIRELILGSDPKAYAAHCQAIVDAQEPDFAAVQVPVRILAGDEDKSAPLDGCKAVLEHVGTSKKELKILDACGHWHCLEHPDRIAQEVETFCSSL